MASAACARRLLRLARPRLATPAATAAVAPRRASWLASPAASVLPLAPPVHGNRWCFFYGAGHAAVRGYASQPDDAETGPGVDVEKADGSSPIVDESKWQSKAIRDETTARRKNIRISPRKLNEIARLVRGLSAEEALIQLRLSSRPKAKYIMDAIENAVNNGINNFNMDPTRLVVSEVLVGKGQYQKRQRWHARGRFGIMSRYYAHLQVKLREQSWEEGEERIGSKGRKIKSVQEFKRIHDEVYAKYADILQRFED
mmetsp:Transcript_31339/g.76447  ORF Transcript_31339/g.76447 Transcript_31339/m.76447 type:complete len:257 (-) Transcript_31339:278-1048(-)